MAYFDSPKNRAMWEKTMVALRAEKERRRVSGYAPVNEDDGKLKEPVNPYRRKINLSQLEEIERQAEGIRRVARPVRQARAGMQMEQDGMQRDAARQTLEGMEPEQPGVRRERPVRRQEAAKSSPGL